MTPKTWIMRDMPRTSVEKDKNEVEKGSNRVCNEPHSKKGLMPDMSTNLPYTYISPHADQDARARSMSEHRHLTQAESTLSFPRGFGSNIRREGI